MQSTKSGGPLAGAWAVLRHLRSSGYADLAAQVFEAVRPHRRRPARWAGAGPPTVHLSVAAATLAVVEELLASLAASVEAARAAGPVDVPQGVRDFIEALDPGALTDDDFDGLLAASGLLADPSAGLALPERMAPVNAMLDIASPALRESLLIAFLDRLQRPLR